MTRLTLTFLGVLIVSSVVAAQKTPEARVNTNPASSSWSERPQIAAVDSTVYVVWDDNRNGLGRDIYFNRSLDGGATWLASDVRVNTGPLPGQALVPRIAASGSAVYVIWRDHRNTSGDVYFNRSLDRGSTWLTSDVRINTAPPGASAEDSCIAVEGSSVYVVWRDFRYRTDIYFNRSLDHGTTWLGSDVRLTAYTAGTAHAQAPVIAASGSSVYVVWHDNRNGQSDIYFNRSLDRGTSWPETNVRLDTNPAGAAESANAEIAVSGNSVFVAWYDRRNGGPPACYYCFPASDVYFNRSLDGGVTWLGADVRLNTDPAGSAASYPPRIESSGSSVYVVWQDDRNSPLSYYYFMRPDSDIYFNRSLDGGSTWLPSDLRISANAPGTTPNNNPHIAASGSSVYVTFHRTNDLYFHRSLDGGASWPDRNARLNTARSVGHSHIAASGTAVYATWQVSQNGSNPDIYFTIPFGFQPYGPATPGSSGFAPALDSTGAATIGTTPSLDVTGGLGGASGVVLLGVGPASKISLPVLGGTLLVSPTLGVPIVLGGGSGVPGAGTASLPLSIPDMQALIGANVNAQVLVLDAGAAAGLAMSNGLEMWIG